MRYGILDHLDAIVINVPNLEKKLAALFMHSIKTYEYIENVLVDIFMNFYPSVSKLANDPETKNSPEACLGVIKGLFTALG